ncbi:hypothetical protein SCA6_010597 [Theobroma cacao]
MSSTANSSLTLSITSQNSHALQPNNNISRNSLLVRSLILSILSLFAIISLLDFVVWRIIHPLPPVFEVDSFCISTTPPKHSPLTSTAYDIQFGITNPNKKLSVLMDNFEILVFHGKNMISRERMRPVYLKKMTKESSNIPRDLPHLHGKMIKFKSIQWSKRGVNFDVKVKFQVRYMVWSWLPKRADVEISCRDLSVKFLTAEGKGDLMGGRRECSAHFQ